MLCPILRDRSTLELPRLLAALSSLGLLACGGAPEPTAAAEAPIANGEVVTGMPLLFLDNGAASCSAVQLTARWILTNRHCNVVDKTDLDSAEIPLSSLSARYPGSNTFVGFDRRVHHPTWDATLLRLEQPIPVPRKVGLYEGTWSSLLGQAIDCYGYQGSLSLTHAAFEFESPSDQAGNRLYFKQNEDGAHVEQGDSGGGCFVKRGDRMDLVGLNFAVLRTPGGTTSIAHGIPPMRDWIFANTNIWTASECDQSFDTGLSGAPALVSRQGPSGPELQVAYRRTGSSALSWKAASRVSAGRISWAVAGELPYTGGDDVELGAADDYAYSGTSVVSIGARGSAVRLIYGAATNKKSAILRVSPLSASSRRYTWSGEATVGGVGDELSLANDVLSYRAADGTARTRSLRHAYACRYVVGSGYSCGMSQSWGADASLANYAVSGAPSAFDATYVPSAGSRLFAAVSGQRVVGGVLSWWPSSNAYIVLASNSQTYLRDAPWLPFALDVSIAAPDDATVAPARSIAVVRDVTAQLDLLGLENTVQPLNAYALDKPSVVHHGDEFYMAYRDPSARLKIRPVGNCLANSPPVTRPWGFVINGQHEVVATP